MRLLYSLFLPLFFLASCGSKAVRFERDPKSLRKNSAVIFVPGYYGSALADDATGERVFTSGWKALFSTDPLAINTPDLGVDGARGLRSDGVLEYIRILPAIASFNIYGHTLNFLRDKFSSRALIVPFDYDWRQEISKTSGKLDELIRELQAEGVTKIAIVAHSMGGLVTAYYLRYGGQDPFRAVEIDINPSITAVVIAGTPFAGSATAFRNLQTGTSLGRSPRPLNALSLGTFGSIYELMPLPRVGAYQNSNGKAFGAEVLSPENWRQQGLGLFRRQEPVTDEVQKKREFYAARALNYAEKFHERLHAPATLKPSSLPVLYFIGKGRPTFSHSVWSQPTLKEAGRWLYDGEMLKQTLPNSKIPDLTADGDNTVLVTSATPSKGLLTRFPGTIIKAEAAHESILDDDSLRSRVENFLTPNL